jgi:hypothetical protein
VRCSPERAGEGDERGLGVSLTNLGPELGSGGAGGGGTVARRCTSRCGWERRRGGGLAGQ